MQVEYDMEVERYNPATDEYDYPTYTVTLNVYRERDYDGHKYTTAEITDIEDEDGNKVEMTKDEEEHVVDEVIANHSWG